MPSKPVWRSLEPRFCPAVQGTGESSQSSLGSTLWQAGDPARTCELLDDAILGIPWNRRRCQGLGAESFLESVSGFMSFLENGLPITGDWFPSILCMFYFPLDFQFLQWAKPAGDDHHKICRCWCQNLQTVSKNEPLLFINHLVSGILL